MSTQQVVFVPRVNLAQCWLRCRPWIAAALDHAHNGTTVDDVWRGLQDGRYRLALMVATGEAWGASLDDVDGCAVVAKEPDPQRGGDMLALMGAGGSGAREWTADLFHALIRMAAGEGCSRIVVVGRPGWSRILVPLGAKKTGEVFSYELTAADRVPDFH